jgi:hypothetical protein
VKWEGNNKTTLTSCYCRGQYCNFEEVNMMTGEVVGRKIVDETTTSTTVAPETNGATLSNWNRGGIISMLIVSTGIMMMHRY